MTRLYKSRPNRSVPNQLAADGSRRRWDGSIEIGSTVASHGAAIDASTIANSSAPPIATVGWRRRNAATPLRPGGATESLGVASAVATNQYRIRGSSTV